MKKGKILWGLLFILAAVYVLISALGILPDIGVFRIILSIILVLVIIDGIHDVDFYQILFPIAFLLILYDEELGVTQITPWPVLVAALLCSIGLSMMIKKPKTIHTENSTYSKVDSQADGSSIYCENSFGSTIKYINSDDFCNASLKNSFGSMKVFFDNAMIQHGSAYVDVDNSFGELDLYVPKTWHLDNRLDSSFGGVKEVGSGSQSLNPTLVLTGSTNFGGTVIYYV